MPFIRAPFIIALCAAIALPAAWSGGFGTPRFHHILFVVLSVFFLWLFISAVRASWRARRSQLRGSRMG